MVSREAVLARLKQVIDPELGVNIVDLGLVYDVTIKRSRQRSAGTPTADVSILMTLTTPGCPLAGVFDRLVGDAVRDIEGVGEVSIGLTFDPPWTPEVMSEEAKATLGFG